MELTDLVDNRNSDDKNNVPTNDASRINTLKVCDYVAMMERTPEKQTEADVSIDSIERIPSGNKPRNEA